MSAPVFAQNIAPTGTAYRWAHGNTAGADGRSETEPNSVRVAAPRLNDGDHTVDVDLSGGDTERSAQYEAAGVVWSDGPRLIDRVEIVHGSWDPKGDGAFCADLQLQFSNSPRGDWRDSGWTVEPQYAYDSAQTAGVVYTFRGPPRDVRSVRIAGKLHCTDQSSYWANIREVRIFQAGGQRLWSDTTQPTVVDSTDTQGVELGLRFRSTQAGWIKGVRFYKAAANTGAHVGNLWSRDGTLLARASFTGETPSGWQRAVFAAPVRIEANTTYLASYYAPNGRYSVDVNYFAAGEYASGPLRALQDTTDGGNGAFAYGPQSAFPHDTWGSANYWVDVDFEPLNVDTTPPSVPQGLAGIAVDARTVRLQWNDSSDDVGPVRYRVYLDGQASPLGEAAQAEYIHTSAQPQMSYTYRVSAVDAAGNESARSAPVSVTTPAGTERSCPPFPAFPDETCTGIPDDVHPVEHPGTFTTSRNGQVIEALTITGDLRVEHDNVTVANSRIKGIVRSAKKRGLVLKDVDLGPDACPTRSNGGTRLIHNANGYTLIRSRLHHNGADMLIVGDGDPVVIQDSLVYKTCYYPDDHLDAVQFYSPDGTGHLSILHSVIDARPSNLLPGEVGYGNAAVFWADRPGRDSTLTIDKSLLAGGGYTLAPYDSGAGSGVIVRVTDTRFVTGSQQYGACELGGNSPENHSPTIPYDENKKEGIVWEGNAWTDGKALPSCRPH